MSIISLIAAIAENGAIGREQQLLWRLPNDLKFFKGLTSGHVIVMGRKTFESLPNGALPNRTNVVLTTQSDVAFDNCQVFHSPEEAFKHFEQEEEIFVIGGSQIYAQTLAYADKLYITHVKASYEDADAFFPSVDWNQWEEIERQDYKADEKHLHDYSFVTYQRKR